MSMPSMITLAGINLQGSVHRAAAAVEGGVNSNPFENVLKDAISQVGALEEQARSSAAGLITGNGVDVHQAVIAEQKAAMAFELTLSVRNKAVQAYQSVMGMQF